MSDLPKGIQISRAMPTHSYRHAPDGDFVLTRTRAISTRIAQASAAGVLVAVGLGVLGFFAATLFAIASGPVVYDPSVGTIAVLVLSLIGAVTAVLRFRYGVRTQDELSRAGDTLRFREVIGGDESTLHVENVRSVSLRTLLVRTTKSVSDAPPRELIAFKGRDAVLVLETKDEQVIGVFPMCEPGQIITKREANKLVFWLETQLSR